MTGGDNFCHLKYRQQRNGRVEATPTILSIFDEYWTTKRAETLSYPVVGELVSVVQTGDWLETDRFVELSRIWMHANGAQFEWQDNNAIARTAADFAPDAFAAFDLKTETVSPQTHSFALPTLQCGR